MPKIKLKEWADRNNLSYITANRHFHAGLIPSAVQLDSGTILVEDDSMEQNMTTTGPNDAMSLFLKKTVEFSKNNSSVEDFAAYVISNFQLKINGQVDAPRYSKNRPKSEEIQKHFQQFLPDKEKVEQLKNTKNHIKEQNFKKDSAPFIDAFNEEKLQQEAQSFARTVDTVTNDSSEDFNDIGVLLSSMAPQTSDVHVYGPKTTTEGLVTRSVDFDTTPQQINYTGSTSQAFSGSSLSSAVMSNSVSSSANGDFGGMFDATSAAFVVQPIGVPFQPTQKELLSAAQVIETAETEEVPRKRGRKPTLRKK